MSYLGGRGARGRADRGRERDTRRRPPDVPKTTTSPAPPRARRREAAVLPPRERLELRGALERAEHRVGLQPAAHLGGIGRERAAQGGERLLRLAPQRVERGGVVVEEE